MIIIAAVITVLIFFIFLHYSNDITSQRKLDISVVFSPPGGGKTTLMTRFAEQARIRNEKNKKKKRYVPLQIYTNVPIKSDSVIQIERSDLGKYNFHDCIILVDEAGVEFNNRDYKNLSHDLIKYLKYHRHFRCQMVFFSQSYEDMDITIRRLAQRYYLVKKTLFSFITHRFVVRRIKKHISIQKETKQIIDAYEFVPLSRFRFSGRKYFKLFNSYETYPLPEYSTKTITTGRSIKS